MRWYQRLWSWGSLALLLLGCVLCKMIELLGYAMFFGLWRGRE